MLLRNATKIDEDNKIINHWCDRYHLCICGYVWDNYNDNDIMTFWNVIHPVLSIKLPMDLYKVLPERSPTIYLEEESHFVQGTSYGVKQDL